MTEPTHICGHWAHQNLRYHLEAGRAFARYILWALEAAYDNALDGAELNALAADQLLYQYGTTCEDCLRDFIAGLASANERYLEALGTTIHS